MTDTAYTPWKRDDPEVTVTITKPDIMSVTVFGLPYTFPDTMGPLTRASFGKVMDHLWGVLGRAFTVEVIETDGTRQGGVIDLCRTPDLPPTPLSTPILVGGARQDDHVDKPAGDSGNQVLGDTVNKPDRDVLEEADWVHLVDEPDDAVTPDLTTSTAQSVTPGVFWPGEQIAVYLWAGVTTADQSGHPSGHLPDWLTGELLIAGRSSGIIQTIPARCNQ